ncbi:MAG: type II secretion system protein [Alphaproteobacteria bacterium]
MYYKNGFTLVELAVAMVIIGLLVGGVLKGQELIQNARLNRYVKQTTSYVAALSAFYDKYRQWPGDLSNPGNKIIGCAALNTCVNAGGNGDSIVGVITNNWSRDDQSALNSEATQFWFHLTLSDFISGLTLENSQGWGDLYPSSPLGGGFQVAHVREAGENPASGIFLISRDETTGDPHPSAPGEAVLTPFQAAFIDRKIDDGSPRSGAFLADGVAGNCFNLTTFKYVEDSNDAICITAYKLR